MTKFYSSFNNIELISPESTNTNALTAIWQLPQCAIGGKHTHTHWLDCKYTCAIYGPKTQFFFLLPGLNPQEEN